MEYLFTNSTVTAMLIPFVIIFIILQIMIDFKDINHSQILQRKMMIFAKKQSEKSISIVINLKNNATTILPLIDHLYSHKYDKLEIIVVTHRTAGKKARTVLEKYRRINHLKHLRIIQYSKKTKLDTILRRYSTGSLIMTMDADDRLSDGFFANASLESRLSENNQIILPRNHIRLDNTITSALQAHVSLIMKLITNFTGRKVSVWPLLSGVIYNRKDILSNDLLTNKLKLFDDQKIYVSKDAPINKLFEYLAQQVKKTTMFLKSWLGLVSIVLIFGVPVALFALLSQTQILLFAVFIVGIYTLTSLMIQMRTKGYSFIDNINLLLIAPLYLLLIIGIYIYSIIKLILNPLVSIVKK